MRTASFLRIQTCEREVAEKTKANPQSQRSSRERINDFRCLLLTLTSQTGNFPLKYTITPHNNKDIQHCLNNLSSKTQSRQDTKQKMKQKQARKQSQQQQQQQ
ncbi:hypothetical protein CAOG_010243, partial [Capsaspora owczarzaki ATCC 30864]